MAAYLSKVWLFCVGLQFCFYVTSAYEYCGYYNGKYWHCDDYGSSVGYCCGFSGGQALCCTYTAFWGLWYFWFGIVTFFFLLSGCLAAYRRYRFRRYVEARRQVQVHTVTNKNYVPQYGAANSDTNAYGDVPPSYVQAQQQGINPQFQDYEKQNLPEGAAAPYPTQYNATPYPTSLPVSNQDTNNQ